VAAQVYFHGVLNNQSGPAIVVDHLLVRRGEREVLPDLSLTVPRGEVVGLLGPSGGGKTTLMRSVVGVQVIHGGTVTVLGEVAGSPALRSRVGYVTQDPSVYADLTVRANLTYFARIAGAPRRAVDDAIARVDLGSHADERVDRLSGGQRSRVSLAAALVGGPELLVLDEPTVGLDPLLRRDLWQLFHELAAAGATLLVSSHVMDEAERCDSLLLLRDGKLIASGSPDDLRARTGEHGLDAVFLRLVEAQT